MQFTLVQKLFSKLVRNLLNSLRFRLLNCLILKACRRRQQCLYEPYTIGWLNFNNPAIITTTTKKQFHYAILQHNLSPNGQFTVAIVIAICTQTTVGLYSRCTCSVILRTPSDHSQTLINHALQSSNSRSATHQQTMLQLLQSARQPVTAAGDIMMV